MANVVWQLPVKQSNTTSHVELRINEELACKKCLKELDLNI